MTFCVLLAHPGRCRTLATLKQISANVPKQRRYVWREIQQQTHRKRGGGGGFLPSLYPIFLARFPAKAMAHIPYSTPVVG